MNVRPEVQEVVRWFVRRGDRHLDAAVILVNADGNNVADATCYHCIEAVDKYVKALLTLHNISAPRTHDLNYIHNLLPERSRLRIDGSDLIYLSTYGIERWWDPDHAQAVRALEIARQVREQIGKTLNIASILT
jgi:HEPN domain-containing protein